MDQGAIAVQPNTRIFWGSFPAITDKNLVVKCAVFVGKDDDKDHRNCMVPDIADLIREDFRPRAVSGCKCKKISIDAQTPAFLPLAPDLTGSQR